MLSSSCASERVRRSPQCGGSRYCQSPLQWRRVLPCLVKLPEQGVCVGLLLPPLGAAHAEMQQLGAVWGCISVQHLPVCYRYFDCFDSFSGWYGMVVLQVVFDSLIFVRHLIV